VQELAGAFQARDDLRAWVCTSLERAALQVTAACNCQPVMAAMHATVKYARSLVLQAGFVTYFEFASHAMQVQLQHQSCNAMHAWQTTCCAAV
jgi:hypothetical protein